MTEVHSGAGQPSGNDCDSKSIFQYVTDFLKSLSSLKDWIKVIFDAGFHVSKTISKYLETLSEIDEFLRHSDTIRMIDNLKSDLVAVKNTLSILFYKLDALSSLVLNDDIQQSVITALKKGNVAPLKAFLTKVQLAINKIVEAYKEFIKVYELLEDSIKQRCQQCDHYLSTAKFKKREIKYTGTFWVTLFGTAAIILGLFGVAAIGGWITLGTGYAVLLGLGFSATTVCALGTSAMSYYTYSEFSRVERKLQEMHTELCQIIDNSFTLKNTAREAYMTLQKCSAKVDTLLLVCEEQGEVETLNMLNDVTDITKELKSKQAKHTDEQSQN